MKKIIIWVCNPVREQSVRQLREAVDSHLEIHPEALLTWLQSSASYADTDGNAADEHVLTCISEHEVSELPAKQSKQRKGRK